MLYRKKASILALLIGLCTASRLAADESVLVRGSEGADNMSWNGGEADSFEIMEPWLRSLGSTDLRALAAEVLERNPEIARAKRLAVVAETQAPRVRSLPDPVAAVSLFVMPAETRTGPQRLNVSIRRQLPWFGKLALRERAALYGAAAAREDVRRVRLDTLAKVRELAHELSFLDAYRTIVNTERGSLVRYEKSAQARYAAGTGLQQGILRIQAQITRIDTRLLEIAERQSSLTARLNRLRDRPTSTPIGDLGANDPAPPTFSLAELRPLALDHRPEPVAAEARIAAASALVELAEKDSRPDLTLGLSYTMVDRRNDEVGRLFPPEGNGDDILALTGSVNLPVRRQRSAAILQGAEAAKWAAEEAKRAVLADIDATLGDLTTRMPLLFEHLSLLEGVLQKQAREALRSAETAYSTGKLNAVDLLDAEVVLFEVQIAAARARADLAVAWSELERAVGRPLTGPWKCHSGNACHE